MKELSNSIFNQLRYNTDPANSNILDFNKELIRKNPMNSMQYNWQIAQMRKTFVFFCTLPFIVGEEFFKTWANVYSPKGEK